MKKRIFTLLIAALTISGLHAQYSIQGQHCPGTSTVTDIDGNIYNTVLIGDQCWMKENLKTTQYRDGTPIVNPNNSDWQITDTGAYAWYDNDISWKDNYGALYNWNAVNNANGLCPSGWHVPSDAEWTQLVDYVLVQDFPNEMGNPDGAGNALKSCRQENSPLGGECYTSAHPRWEANDTHHGFDEFGFAGLPGGGRYGYSYDDVFFRDLGYTGSWWSTTMDWTYGALLYKIDYEYGYVQRSGSLEPDGFSVRCLRD